ncbi:MAG TPA: hypothetical protein VL132_23155 [Planctomycetaceae bacterium]|nr:hypothetical protein [Planctomycetaceae bacterium]
MKHSATFTVLFVTAIAGLTVGDVTLAAEKEAVASLERLPIDADDLVSATGLNIYKFQTQLPKDQKFEVVLREIEAKDHTPRVLHRFPFRHGAEGPVILRASFLRRDRKLEGVLLNGGQEAEYRLELPDCSPSGIATIVAVPLAGLAPTQKTLFVHGSTRDQSHLEPGEIGLLTLVASEPGKPASMNAYPRAELLIQPVND